MKSTFYTQRELTIEGKPVKAGEELAVIETPEGIPVEKALAAIGQGFATESKPPVDPTPSNN